MPPVSKRSLRSARQFGDWLHRCANTKTRHAGFSKFRHTWPTFLLWLLTCRRTCSATTTMARFGSWRLSPTTNGTPRRASQGWPSRPIWAFALQRSPSSSVLLPPLSHGSGTLQSRFCRDSANAVTVAMRANRAIRPALRLKVFASLIRISKDRVRNIEHFAPLRSSDDECRGSRPVCQVYSSPLT